jgi:peroxiredoxin
MKTPTPRKIALVLLTLSLALGAGALAQPPVPDTAEKVSPLAVGSKVPKVNVKTMEDKTIELPRLLSAQPTVLIFYRGGWCPFCNRQMSSLQSIEGDLKKLGYRILAVSPDRAVELKKSLGKNKLTYQLLSDSSMDAAKAFGVAFKVDDGVLTKYKGFGIDLEVASGEKHHYLPVPSVFLIGADGVIKFRSFNPDYKVRLSNDELLTAARQSLAP